MMVLRFESDKGDDPLYMVILEPGNLAKLEQGKPICKNLKEFGHPENVQLLICYTPDIDYVSRSILAGTQPSEALEKSLQLPKVIRGSEAAEQMVKVNLVEEEGHAGSAQRSAKGERDDESA